MRKIVLLTDLFGASVCSAFASLTRHGNVTLLSGMNLPMLLGLLMEYPQPMSEADTEHLLRDAKEQLMSVHITVTQEGDDF